MPSEPTNTNQRSGARRPAPPGLQDHWDKPLKAFVTLPSPTIDGGLAERHRLYGLLVLALIASQWNGNKYGNAGNYGDWRLRQLTPDVPPEMGIYAGGSYFGHNIAAIAVDARGNIIDFEFNHNELFNSSVEHAESRLLRRLFSLAQVSDSWLLPRPDAWLPPQPDIVVGDQSVAQGYEWDWRPLLLAVSEPPSRWIPEAARKRRPYSKLLTDVTVYTSLESCAQCSGIMALADVREVIYLQPDDGQYLIGNMMYSATRSMGYGARAPEPIPAEAFGFRQYSDLSNAYLTFARRVPQEPFFQDAEGKKTDASITSFLCTDLALDVVSSAAGELASIDAVTSPEYVRPNRDGGEVPDALTNAQVLERVRRFLRYVQDQGGRGTAHRA